MADRGGGFRFFQGSHGRVDIKIDISSFARPITTTFGKQVIQMRLIRQVLVTSKPRDKLKTLYLHYQGD